MERDPLGHLGPDAQSVSSGPSVQPLGASTAPGGVAAFLRSLRPDQWTKNLIVFAGLLFGQRLVDGAALATAVAAFSVFCALSSAMYLVNDVLDREEDRRHPVKSRRPIAAGLVSPGAAMTGAVALSLGGLAAAFWVGPLFGGIALAFLVLLYLYSQTLKHIVILDVLAIATGFVLRAVAGAVAVAVPISQWLLICTLLLALFLGFAKRRHELVLLGGEAAGHRRALAEYSPQLLDQLITVVAAATVVSYAFYTVEPETVEKFQTDQLTLTLPFPVYGIFRYLYLVHRRDGGGSPSELLLSDRPLLACVALWAIAVVVIIYHPF